MNNMDLQAFWVFLDDEGLVIATTDYHQGQTRQEMEQLYDMEIYDQFNVPCAQVALIGRAA
jgi:hypothetical protein